MKENESGAVLVFVTLMIVLLMIMIGMGLDTGHLAYIRSQGQPAVDAAALAAASAIHTDDPTQVEYRAKAFNSTNDYLDSPNNLIGSANVTLINYDASRTPPIQTASGTSGTSTGDANGVRVALESTNPYGGTPNTSMKSPLFLTPLFNLFGIPTAKTANVSVSAVAIVKTAPDLPIAMEQGLCGTKVNGQYQNNIEAKLLQANAADETSGYTTFHIPPTSKTQVHNMLMGGLNCSGAASVGIGFCTELGNGQVASLYPEFESVFLAGKPEGRCYLIPVVGSGVNFNGCSNIMDFAKFCPKQGDDGWGVGKTKSEDGTGWDKYIIGDVTCGANPNTTKWAKCHVTSLVRDAKSGM
jgi:Flp pilus assembly protein TadG